MPRKPRPPYLKRIAQRGAITIWRVDGSYIRTHRDEEFSNYGHHNSFPFIPKNQFWVDEASPDEDKFFIHHLLVEYRWYKKGLSQDEARQKANASELRLRQKTGDVQRLTRGGKLPDPEQVHIELWKKLEVPVSVWIVNGRLVRSVFDIDFTEGGHGHVYEYIPQDEVWIDNDVTDAERPYVLLHELHERHLMAQGWDYDRAHADSSRLEKRCRRHPEQLHRSLSKEGWD
jgi:hypothetical protein